jgi:hypothetical protein
MAEAETEAGPFGAPRAELVDERKLYWPNDKSMGFAQSRHSPSEDPVSGTCLQVMLSLRPKNSGRRVPLQPNATGFRNKPSLHPKR